ncbi:hypothetical protein GCM10027436_54690 [Actinophytocola sediminis]
MMLRRALALLVASVAAVLVSGEAVATPDQGQPPVLELDLPRAGGVARAEAETGSFFTGRSPERVLDTRVSLGASGPVGARGTISLDLSGHVPEHTTAVVLNLTGVKPTAPTHLRVWPAAEPMPTVSNLNLATGEVRANAVTVALGADRRLKLYNFAGSVDLVADLAGHYGSDASGRYNSPAPRRVLDTRTEGRPVGPGGIIYLNTSSFVDSLANAVTINLTVVSPTANTYLTAYPSGDSDRPNASSINAAKGAVTANQVTVALGPGRDIQLYNHSGSAHVVVDLVGYYGLTGEDLFYPVSPVRAVDTRISPGVPLKGGWYIGFDVQDMTFHALAMNITATNATKDTYLTVYPAGTTPPLSSTVNVTAGRTVANTTTVGLAWEIRDNGLQYWGYNVYNHSGNVHFVMDLAGYFAN